MAALCASGAHADFFLSMIFAENRDHFSGHALNVRSASDLEIRRFGRYAPVFDSGSP
jgi:hypothetical protein